MLRSSGRGSNASKESCIFLLIYLVRGHHIHTHSTLLHFLLLMMSLRFFINIQKITLPTEQNVQYINYKTYSNTEGST